MHVTADDDIRVARTTSDPQKRTYSCGCDAAAMLAATVMVLPPAARHTSGCTESTATSALRRRTRAAPDCEKSMPFRLSSIVVSRARIGGSRHSTELELRRAPSMTVPVASARHHTLLPDPKPPPITVTACRPPADPSDGCTPRTVTGV